MFYFIKLLSDMIPEHTFQLSNMITKKLKIYMFYIFINNLLNILFLGYQI